jgi:hypothetical protein
MFEHSLLLHCVVEFNKALRDRNKKCDNFDDMETAWRSHGDDTEVP